MKPNIVIAQPANIECDAAIDIFCESLSETHYVYLIRPGSAPRDDSPAGVRFLNHALDRLPGFADIETAIAIGDDGVADHLRKAYPQCELRTWDPEMDDTFLESFLSSGKVVEGSFGVHHDAELAKAM